MSATDRSSNGGPKEDLRSADLVKAGEYPGQLEAVLGCSFREPPAPIAVHEQVHRVGGENPC